MLCKDKKLIYLNQQQFQIKVIHRWARNNWVNKQITQGYKVMATWDEPLGISSKVYNANRKTEKTILWQTCYNCKKCLQHGLESDQNIPSSQSVTCHVQYLCFKKTLGKTTAYDCHKFITANIKLMMLCM